MQKNKYFKIAHISDLHFDDTENWTSHFNQLERSLLLNEPDIIVNTGDLLNSPSESNYLKLSNKISDLCQKLENTLKKNIYFISVPGNHDYLTFGCLPNKNDVYSNCANLLNYPQLMTIKNIITDIYEKSNIAIYPFDSNQIEVFSDLFGMAQGKIIDTEGDYLNLNKCFNNIDKAKLRIALLHHHPLPMAVTTHEELKEPFLILRKAHAFLIGSLANKIDLILHGHMHRLGACEYRSILPVDAGKTLRIFGCGSSGDPSESKREYAIHLVGETGDVRSQIYESCFSTKSYSPDKIFHLIPYKDVRKIRNRNAHLYEKDALIESARMKSKIVMISKKGDAIVDVFGYNIKWCQGYHTSNDFLVHEQVTADVGRIPWYNSYLGSSEPVETTFEKQLEPANKLDFMYNLIAENVKLTVKRQNCDINKEYHYQFRYPMLSGYCLTKSEHENIYSSDAFQHRREFCYASTNYQTDILEINITLPKISFLPKDIVLVAAKKEKNNFNINDFSFIKQSYDLCETETAFLKTKNALRILPNSSTISAHIRYPQPDLIYIIRWELPDIITRNEITYRRCLHIRENIYKKVLSSQLFTQTLNVLDKYLPKCKFDLVLLSIGVDDESGVAIFKGIEGNSRYINKSFFLTRGIAGRAYKNGFITYFDRSTLDDRQYFEKLDSDFDPFVAISMPIILTESGIKIQNNVESFDPDSQVICVFSIVYFDDPGPVSKFNFTSIQNELEPVLTNTLLNK